MQTKFEVRNNGLFAPPIDPSDLLDYTLELDDVINDDPSLPRDTVSTATWTCTTGLTVNSLLCTVQDTSATVWLHQGVLGSVVTVTMDAVTVRGRRVNRSFKVEVKEL